MKKLLLLIAVIIQSGCAFFLSYIKDKKPSAVETPKARIANEYMWDQLHLGNYDSIPIILEKLNLAYELDPNDAKVSAHLGFVYLWKFSERVRAQKQDRILENVFLSNRFFREAITLNPGDARLYGFQAAVQMCEGALTNNLELLAKSYFSSMNAIRKWRQFNKFALGYVESQIDTGSRLYKKGIKYQWEIMDECTEAKITKDKIMSSPTEIFTALYHEINTSHDSKVKRACGNSWIAPHNWEGFFLNFGDMLVKAGRLDQAMVIYQAAKISPSYQEWVYKEILEERLTELNQNLQLFNRKQNLMALDGRSQMMINSEFSCAGCHQMNFREFTKATDENSGAISSTAGK